MALSGEELAKLIKGMIAAEETARDRKKNKKDYSGANMHGDRMSALIELEAKIADSGGFRSVYQLQDNPAVILLTPDEVAATKKLSVGAIYLAIRTGRLKAIRSPNGKNRFLVAADEVDKVDWRGGDKKEAAIPEGYIAAPEAAKRLGLSLNGLYGRVASKRLSALKGQWGPTKLVIKASEIEGQKRNRKGT